ncbi:MAG: energy transducer TonB [Fluviicola sp.]
MIQIPDPCSEDWSKMKIVREGRHCLSCTKNVIDFTKMERYEIIEYLLLNKNKSVCGHINKSMLDFDVEELYITVQRAETVKRNSNLAFCILSMGALFLASCSNETPKSNSNELVEGKFKKIEVSTNGKTESTNSSNENKSINKTGFVAPHLSVEKINTSESKVNLDDPLTGFISCTTVGQVNNIYDYTDPSPEFPGGMSALRKYLSDSIRLPADFDQTGKIYVKFVVSEEGKISKVMIIRNYTQDERITSEVIRLIKAMPNWKPGQVDGKNVNSYFTIPISIHFD